jgi:sec-independent protein translocase protein TatC
VVCLVFGERVVSFFCAPLYRSLHKHGINPQVYYKEVTEGFIVYMQISLICAAVIAGPWLIYHVWAFVRSGLYPKERKTVTKYIPFSIVLLISGMLFLYYFILPISLDFLIGFSASIPISGMANAPIVERSADAPRMIIPSYKGDPKDPAENEIWLDTEQKSLKAYVDKHVVIVPFAPRSLLAPMITLADYVDLVLRWLIIFGLSFQMPLVILSIARIGLVDIPTLKKYRKIVYFIITVISAVVVPDVVTGMIAMMVPMALLYELGIFLAARAIKKSELAAAEEEKEEAK